MSVNKTNKGNSSQRNQLNVKDEIIEVEVHSVSSTTVWVGIDDKKDYDIALSEFDKEDIPKVGDRIKVVYTKTKSGQIQLSKKQAIEQGKVSELEEYYKNRTPLDGKVKSFIDGPRPSFVVELLGGLLEGRCSANLIDLKVLDNFDHKKYLNLEDKFVISKIAEIPKNKSQLIFLSRKSYLIDKKNKESEEFFSTVKQGDIVDGKVYRISTPLRKRDAEGKPIPLTDAEKKQSEKEFVLVYIGGSVIGIIEKPELSWGYVGRIGNIVKSGQQIKVKVLSLDKEKREVKLSLKATQENPWITFADRHTINEKIEGTVTNIVDNLGIFVEIEKGIEGMVHFSDLSWVADNSLPSQTFQRGQKIKVQILGFDLVERKISLGYKQLQDSPWKTLYQRSSRLTRKIIKITDNMLIVELEKGIEGTVSIEDVSWINTPKSLSEQFEENQEIEVMVLSADAVTKKIKLGIKQLTEDPFIKFKNLKNNGKSLEVSVLEIKEDGIIVDLENGITGIITQKDKSEEAVEVGSKIKCSILNIKNSGEHKVFLTNKKITQQRQPSSERRSENNFSSLINQPGSSDDRVTLRDILNKDNNDSK